MEWDQIETPALLLDERKLNNNIERMIKVKDTCGVNVRPHFKTHKSVWIAKQQLKAGACGITVAKVSEAELLLENGVKDVLVAFPLTDPRRIRRLIDCLAQARVILTVDSIDQGEILNKEAGNADCILEVWIKINSGLNRCGIEPGMEAFELAKKIEDCKHLQLTGMYTHGGHSYKATSAEELDKIAKEEAESVLQSVQLCESEGILIANRSVGSTPTFERAAKYKGITEVRPGNAVFFDAMQVGIGIAAWEETALTILATVVSKKKDRLIVDAGSKALTTEKGAHGNEAVKGFGRLLLKNKEMHITRVSEEHGILDVEENEGLADMMNEVKLNDTVEIHPNHACVAANLFDSYYLINENGELTKLPVDARGKSQ